MTTVLWIAVTVALIGALPPTGIAFLAWRESRKTHKIFNSRVTELLAAKGREAYAEGVRDTKAKRRKKS